MSAAEEEEDEGDGRKRDNKRRARRTRFVIPIERLEDELDLVKVECELEVHRIVEEAWRRFDRKGDRKGEAKAC